MAHNKLISVEYDEMAFAYKATAMKAAEDMPADVSLLE